MSLYYRPLHPSLPSTSTALRGLSAVLLLSLLPGGIHAQTQVNLTPDLDNTIFEESSGLSNGAGDLMYVGVTGLGNTRRALLHFNVSGNVPEHSEVQSVSLRLEADKVTNNTARTLSLHWLDNSWGEGSSNSTTMPAGGSGGGGAGGTAANPDVTWSERFHNGATWTIAGGDFDPTASASVSVSTIGVYSFTTNTALVADVQAWVDDPSSNFGWILKYDAETNGFGAKRFRSSEHATASSRPQLTIVFNPPIFTDGFESGNTTQWSSVVP